MGKRINKFNNPVSIAALAASATATTLPLPDTLSEEITAKFVIYPGEGIEKDRITGRQP
jgi:hypothetical protein